MKKGGRERQTKPIGDRTEWRQFSPGTEEGKVGTAVPRHQYLEKICVSIVKYKRSEVRIPTAREERERER
jgi:hypothetical protein